MRREDIANELKSEGTSESLLQMQEIKLQYYSSTESESVEPCVSNEPSASTIAPHNRKAH
jgi:hypothetical protein